MFEENSHRDKVIASRKENIVATIRTEVKLNPELFSGELSSIKIAAVDFQMGIFFEPALVANHLQTEFVVELSNALYELKKIMTDDDFGSWISITIHLDEKSNSSLFLFNYDEFEEDIFSGFSKETFIREIEMFPRKKSFIPNWWNEYIQ